jgi:hypothetical protein
VFILTVWRISLTPFTNDEQATLQKRAELPDLVHIGFLNCQILPVPDRFSVFQLQLSVEDSRRKEGGFFPKAGVEVESPGLTSAARAVLIFTAWIYER